jgi:SAM-dependent methyltransferase
VPPDVSGDCHRRILRISVRRPTSWPRIVGAGTGISARLLGDRGVRVTAIEPGERTCAALRRPHPNVVWTAALAEATGLRSASVDLVLSAQSFHWFRLDEALPELARILKPPAGWRSCGIGAVAPIR